MQCCCCRGPLNSTPHVHVAAQQSLCLCILSFSERLRRPVPHLVCVVCLGLQVSVENGLIVTRGIRRPLVIDPQQQCTRRVVVKAG